MYSVIGKVATYKKFETKSKEEMQVIQLLVETRPFGSLELQLHDVFLADDWPDFDKYLGKRVELPVDISVRTGKLNINASRDGRMPKLVDEKGNLVSISPSSRTPNQNTDSKISKVG